MFFSHHPQVFLFMQYVILRAALHEVLIVIALGHVEANVKSFKKKIFKIIIISKRFQMKKNKIKKKMKIKKLDKLKLLFHFKTKNI